MTNKIALVIAILALVLGGVALTNKTEAPVLGGLVEYQAKIFSALATFKGGTVHSSTYSTSSPASATLLLHEILNRSTLAITPTVGAITITLPTATVLGSGFLPSVGDSTEFTILNATGTAAATITIAGNTGVTLRKATTTSVVAGGSVGTVKLIRSSATAFQAMWLSSI